MSSQDIIIFEEFEEALDAVNKRFPFVLKNYDIGPCSNLWDFSYLSKKIGENSVKVHVSTHANMDFIGKNFLYKTLQMKEMLERIKEEKPNNFFIDPSERYYLRALGINPRGRDVADLKKHWPEISNDLIIPPIFQEEQFFSSVLRVSSADVRLWTHYDIMDNILIQVRGRKEVVLWHPKDIDSMYLIGDKSAVLDITNVDDTKFPRFKNAQRHVCTLEEGDILFIPALWFHNTYSLTPGIAVNIFWKNLDSSNYDPKDPYGNKDLICGARALDSIKSAKKNLAALPSEYRNFYLRRMIHELSNGLDDIS